MTTETNPTKAPIRLKIGRVTVKIWENTTDEGFVYPEIDLLRVYKDDSGDFKEVRKFSLADIASIVAMAPQIYAMCDDLNAK